MLKQISVLVAFAGFVSCQPKDVDGWSKLIKWGMTIEEAKAAFGSDAPGQISNVGTFLVKHVEIGSLIIDVTVWSKQHVVSSVQMNAAVPTEHLNTGRRAEMFNILKTLLIEKYGVPKNEDRRPDGSSIAEFKRGSRLKKQGYRHDPWITTLAAQRQRLGSTCREGRRTAHFSWVLVRLPAMRCQELARNRGDCCKLLVVGKPKWKSRFGHL